jgi:hypothetical protein
MKSTLSAAAALALLACPAHAQWITRTYQVPAGWSSIWLAGDASHTPVSTLFAAFPAITEIWRWNPNPDEIQFTSSPATPDTDSEEWTVWKRFDPDEQTLSSLIGNSAYLVRASASTTFTIRQKALMPAATWLISGANFLGFPAATTGTGAPPTFSAYFASFPSANTSVLAPSSQIYRYTGGDLGPSNPMAVTPGTERIDPAKAYWFPTATVSNFTAPVQYDLPGIDGLAFGRSLSAIPMGITNRTTAPLTLSFSLEASEPAPEGQRPIGGSVPLTRRSFNSTSGTYSETPITSGFTVTIPASSRTSLDFGLSRSLLTNPNAGYASLLRIRDTSGYSDVRVPVSAEMASTAGLWAVAVRITDVVSTVPQSSQNSGGTSTPQPFPLLFFIHADASGTARLLSEVYVGKLTTLGNLSGITNDEKNLVPPQETSLKPLRYLSPCLPPHSALRADQPIATGTTVTWKIDLAHNDPTNPFVHQYHPDHDNLDASFRTPLQPGRESYTISRICQFSFSSTPPSGTPSTGWGTTVLGGSYQETLTGLSKNPLSVRGTFTMSRISEISEILLTNPAP